MLSDTYNILKVEISAPTNNGRLFYFVDPEINDDILYIRGVTKKFPAHRINLGGAQALFDADSSKTLTEAQFVQPLKSWKILDELRRPENCAIADIKFMNVAKRHHFIDVNVPIFTVNDKSVVEIWPCEVEPVGQWIALSENCLACVTDNYLTGIWVRRRP